MIAWWNTLDMVQQIFAMIAIPSTLIMVIQTVLLALGWIGDGDVDMDDVPDGEGMSDDGLTLFSVRGIVAMLAVTGWTAIAFIESGLNQILSVMIAIVLGLLTLVGMAYFMRLVYRLQTSGNLDVGNAVGKVAKVYIPIAGNAKKQGKVTMTLQEKYCEFDAITTHSEMLPTGSYVRVVAVDGTGTLVVEPLGEEKKEVGNEEA